MNKRLLIIFVFALCTLPSLYAQEGGVSIGKGRKIAHGKAILELVSDSKGLLIPRLNTTNREAMFTADDATAVGLMVFDIDESAFFFYTGNSWSKIGTGSAISNFVETGLVIPDVIGHQKGELFFETTTNKLAVFDGAVWQMLGNSVVQSLESVLDNGNDAGSKLITNLGNPVNPLDAVNKDYVDKKAQLISEKNQANGYVGLGSDKKVGAEYLPGITLSAVNVENSEASQLALTASEGDLVIRTDINKTYVHNGGAAGDITDWSELLFTNSVTSVNGKTGNVSLGITDISALKSSLDSKLDVPVGLTDKILMIDNTGAITWIAPSIVTDTDDQNLSEVLSQGNDALNKTITGLAIPTNDTDAATKKYVDDKTLQADWDQTDVAATDYIKNKPNLSVASSDIYYGVLAALGSVSESDLTALTTVATKNGLFGQSITSTPGYFTFAMPAGWRKPFLKIDGDDTLLVFSPSQSITINNIEYVVWQTDVSLIAGLTILVN